MWRASFQTQTTISGVYRKSGQGLFWYVYQVFSLRACQNILLVGEGHPSDLEAVMAGLCPEESDVEAVPQNEQDGLTGDGAIAVQAMFMGSPPREPEPPELPLASTSLAYVATSEVMGQEGLATSSASVQSKSIFSRTFRND